MHITLTARARAAGAAHLKPYARRIVAAAADLTPAQRQVMADVLVKILDPG